MSLSTDDVKRIARLARIEIDDAQAQTTQGQLNTIFDLIATMQAVDTTEGELVHDSGRLPGSLSL